jgi:phosphomannomutase
MPTTIKFGTDGWRAVIAEDYTYDNVRRCAQGFASYLRENKKGGRGVETPSRPPFREVRRDGVSVVVGYDTRFSGELFAAAAAEVMAGNGIKAYLCDRPTPTPVISYTILARQADGAINLTASHNPATWNGFKVRSEYASAVDPEGLLAIEARIPPIEGVKRLDRDEAMKRGLIEVIDAAPAFLAHIARLVDIESLRRAGLQVVADPMWGAGMGWFAHIFAGAKTQVTEIHNVRNPLFPEMDHPEPIAPNLPVLMAKVPELQADVGLATDGDADRVGLVDEHGQFINQLQVYGLLALYLLEVRGYRGPIVKTLSTTSMLEKLGELYHVPVYETGVGFKYVAPKMLETDALIGGEESGGYAFRGHIPERDGIVAGLFLLDLMVQTGKKPSELLAWLFEKVGPHYYDRIDTHFDPAAYPRIRQEVSARLAAHPPKELDGSPVVKTRTDDGFKYYLPDGSWVLIRFSGTEPLLRAYTEADSPERVKRLLAAGLALAK